MHYIESAVAPVVVDIGKPSCLTPDVHRICAQESSCLISDDIKDPELEKQLQILIASIHHRIRQLQNRNDVPSVAW